MSLFATIFSSCKQVYQSFAEETSNKMRGIMGKKEEKMASSHSFLQLGGGRNQSGPIGVKLGRREERPPRGEKCWDGCSSLGSNSRHARSRATNARQDARRAAHRDQGPAEEPGPAGPGPPRPGCDGGHPSTRARQTNAAPPRRATSTEKVGPESDAGENARGHGALTLLAFVAGGCSPEKLLKWLFW